MKLKRILVTVLLVFVMIISSSSLVGCSGKNENNEPQYDNAIENFTFQKTEDNTGYIVVSYNGNSDYVSIPDKYDNLPVKEIGEKAFYQLKVYNVIVPDSIEVIGMFAFYSCTNLIKLRLSANLKTIDNHTFHYCSRLAEMTIPDKVTEIGKCAFGNCYKLKTITIGSNVAKIDEDTFFDCTLENVIIKSETVFNSLSEQTSMGGLVNFATIIKVDSSILVEAPQYLQNNFTETATEGYRVFTKRT